MDKTEDKFVKKNYPQQLDRVANKLRTDCTSLLYARGTRAVRENALLRARNPESCQGHTVRNDDLQTE